MDLHRIILFCHVGAMVVVFITLAVEWVSLGFLRRATTSEQAKNWVALWNLLVPLGLPSFLVVLASGIFLATTLGAWNLDWVRGRSTGLGGYRNRRWSRWSAAESFAGGDHEKRRFSFSRTPDE
jgi:hypothetical protein